MKTLDRESVGLTAACALVVTGVDAVLLELKRDYFTGGFLSEDSATAWSDRLAFLAGSVATDAALVVVGVACALLLAGRLQLGTAARWFLALSMGAGPLLVASAVEYQIVAQLGDAFDFHLMFDLVGGRPSEILAVAADYLWAPAFALAAVIVAIGVGTVLLQRWPGGRQRRPLLGALVWQVAVVAMAGLAVMTTLRVWSDVLDNGLRRKPSGQALGALVAVASDVDRDGYGMLSRPPDGAPFDAHVYPYAIDIPGNGVDENGVAGDLPSGDLYTEPDGMPPAFTWTPDVVLIVLETFRADLVGQRVDGKEVTPVLNRLASEGGSAAHAYSHNGYTVQSKHHLFTGSLAALRQGTLVDDFKANGYEVALFSAQDDSFGGPAYDVGTTRADVFYDARQDRSRRFTTFATAGSLGVSSDVLLERIDAHLAQRKVSRPLFLYANIYDAHFPYHHDGLATLIPSRPLAPGDIVPANVAALRAMYANTAANVDRAVGGLIDSVTRHRGAAPAVVVLADHGESLFDEGFLGHGYAINDVQTRIPLVVRGFPMELCEPVGQSDIREAMREALVRGEGDRRPTFRECGAEHRVFQYLGTIDRPRQIAFTSAGGRVIWDFRRYRARIGDGAWQRERDLSPADVEAVHALVHYWERLRLAQHERHR
jgi:hypothetical protein